MPLSQQELDTIVDVVASRLDAREAALKQEFYTAIEAMRQDFYNAVQQLGENQTNLYEMMATRFDPGILMPLAHEFWKRSILAEAARVQVEVEGDWWAEQVDTGQAVGDGPMFSEDEAEHPEPEPGFEPDPSMVMPEPKVKQKPSTTTEE